MQTLPLWIFQNLFRPNQAPVVNVVAAVLVLLSAIPIYLAQRLSGDVGRPAPPRRTESERVGEQSQRLLAVRAGPPACRRTRRRPGCSITSSTSYVAASSATCFGRLVRRPDHPASSHLLGQRAVLLGQAARLGLLDERLRR